MQRVLESGVAPILALSRPKKRAVALTIDAFLCVLTVWIAFYLRVDEWVSLSSGGWPAAVVSLILALPVFSLLGLYRSVFRYAGWETLTAVFSAVLLYGLVYSAIFTAWGVDGVPRSIGLLQPALLLIAVGASRALVRYWLGGNYRHWLNRKSRRGVIIYGAGSAGRQLAAALEHTENRVVAFVDDSRNLHGSFIGRVRIWAAQDIDKLVQRLDVGEIYLAIPSASRTRRNEILSLIRDSGVAVRTLPGLLDLASGRVTVDDLKPLDIEDLLGRDPVAPDLELLERNIRNLTVLVTGAGGSIGSELCRQIVALRPTRLLLFESNEFALYAINRQLERMTAELGHCEVVPLLGSVCDKVRVNSIFQSWKPDTVYHAAAYKHVPMVEHNVTEGIRNNVIGTLVCADSAEAAGVKQFILVSTDKAVRPTNVMGASKRLAEMILQAKAVSGSRTCFSMVRFGNVLGSSGSVVPLFRQQIDAGGPVTVTHRDVTRYFMTIPEAAQLVLQAGAMAEGGEVFVLDMGEPVKVVQLAKRMIQLAGLTLRDDGNPEGDIKIEITGLRPGEKLYEELLIGDDPIATCHPRVMKANEKFVPWPQLSLGLERLMAALGSQNVALARQILGDLVPEYQSSGGLVDWVHVNNECKRHRLKLVH